VENSSPLTLPDHSVVLGVRADPESIDSLSDVDSQRSVMFANADGPKAAELFEMQGRMAGIRLEEGEILIGQRSNFRG
jgi:hypothetical protein